MSAPVHLTRLKETTDHFCVRVPATSANLGVGFDCLGLALDLYASFTFGVADELHITGCEDRFRGSDNMVWTTYQTMCARLDVPARPLYIDIQSDIPLSGGLGSSSTCVVAGVTAAWLLSGRELDPAAIAEAASGIEGHPDNVMPAVMGGLSSSFILNGHAWSSSYEVAPALHFCAIAPPYEVRTVDARRVLPTTIPRETCVWQTGRAVAMVRALTDGDADLLAACCDDRLHEPYRKKLIPDYEAIRRVCLNAGAAAFWISGSGSTMIAACATQEDASKVMVSLEEVRPGWWKRCMSTSAAGLEVLPA